MTRKSLLFDQLISTDKLRKLYRCNIKATC